MFGSQIFMPLVSALRNPIRQPSRVRRFSPLQFTALGFLALILAGAVLLWLPAAQRGTRIGLLDCLFTATSAVTVTGLVTHSTAESWSTFGQAIIMLLIQLGGLGYITAATLVALLLGLRFGRRAEVLTGQTHNVLTSRDVAAVIRYVVIGTLLIEGVGTALLLLQLHFRHGMGWGRALYQGAFYAVSAFCNAGFDLAPRFKGLTYAPFHSDLPFLVILSLLILLGSIGFAVLAELLTVIRMKRFSLQAKMVLSMTALIVVVGAGLFLLFEIHNPHTLGTMPWGQRLITAWFMSISPRTAGFSPIDLTLLSPPTLFILGMLMVIGGAPTSVAGGVKITTVAVIVLAIATLVRQRQDIEIFHRRIGGEVVRLALSLVSFYLLAIILIILGVSLVEITQRGIEPGPAAMARFGQLTFEVVSAFGTVGLGTGITPTLAPLSRALLILAMYLGRLGPLVFVYIFARDKRPLLRRLPGEPIMTG